MLDSGLIDAVLIATPVDFHAAQTIAALQRDLHVLCEVTAAVSIEECRSIVAAGGRSRGHYAMAENFIYKGLTGFVSRARCRRTLWGAALCRG